jgi:Rhodopirellula transposase DDE domain
LVEADEIKTRFEKLAPFLDERMRRLVAATESLAVGFGGTSEVSRQTGVSRRAIIRAGGGRKKTVDTNGTLKADLERLVEPVTRGDPESALRWTCKSARKLGRRTQAHESSDKAIGWSPSYCRIGL